MNENELIDELLRAMVHKDPWHGPALLALVSDLTPAQAAARPIAGAHSIWELVLHVDSWMRIVRERMLGKKREISDKRNWPRVPARNAAAWRRTLANLRRSEQALRKTLLAQPAGRFEVGSKRYDARLTRNAHGTIAHVAYHGGQIALLRRAQGLEPMAG